MSNSTRTPSNLPGRIALLLGLAALSATAGDAGAAPGVPAAGELERVPQQSAKAFGELLIWSEAGRIFVAEAGQPAQELRLGDTPEAARLRELLQREGATSGAPRALRDRVILVGGGGDGFHWAPSRQSNEASKARAAAPRAGGKAPSDAVLPADDRNTAPPRGSTDAARR